MNLDPSTVKTAILINLKDFMIKKTKAVNETNSIRTAAVIYREIADELDKVAKQIEEIDKNEKE